MSSLTPLIAPRSIAIIGASSSREAQGNIVLHNLRKYDYRGTISMVHPTAAQIDGIPAIQSVTQLDEPPDLAFVAVSANQLIDTLVELDAAGVKSAITVAAGFDADGLAELRDVIRGLSMRVNGPNCMGYLNLSDGIIPYVARFRDPLPVGNAALVAQSGSAAIAMMNYTGIGFSKIFTSGNEYGVNSADYIDWLADDPHTQAIGVITESVMDTDQFAAAAAKAHRNGKHVVVLKIGRSDFGARATAAHTGALIGRKDAYDAFFARAGVATVRDYDELGASLQLLSAGRLAHGSRVGIISISGGQSALACDVADEEGIPLAILTAPTQAAIHELLPGADGSNPLDLGATVGSRENRVKAVRKFIEDDDVDSVLLVQDAQGTLPIHPNHDYVTYLIALVAELDGLTKPVIIASSTSVNTHPALEQIVEGAGWPLLRGIRTALSVSKSIVARTPSTPSDVRPSALPDDARLAELRAAIQQAGAGPLPQELTLDVLRAYGLPVVRSVMLDRSGDFADDHGLRFPVVVKVLATGLSHKSDLGGVVVNVADADGVRQAVASIREAMAANAPEVAVDGFEVQEMVADGIELFVGASTDARFGATVLAGTGGVLVELRNDFASAITPITEADAEAMLARTQAGKLLGGYRNVVPPTDLAQIVDVIRRVGYLAADLNDVIADIDINPVIVTPGTGEAMIVDALIITRS